MTELLFAGGEGKWVPGFLDREDFEYLDDRIEGYGRKWVFWGGRHYVICHPKKEKDEREIQGIVYKLSDSDLETLDKKLLGLLPRGQRSFEREQVETHSGLTAWAYIYQK
ncbi:gamma-glutamylcyclotransferase [Candidatus Woesearchaeota archaeon]|nr:gamma-glutamylcyclotransferase [Candidatus Woesearchaeota archaeon]